MNAIAQWLKEKGKIVIPKTLDTQVFDENGKSLNRRLKTAKDEQVIQLPKVEPTMIISDLDYSTEEQLTGKRWTDGKPIYQKTVVIDTPSVTGKDVTYPHGIENVDEIIDGKTTYIRSDGISYTEPIYISNSIVRACAFDATNIYITLQSMNISTIKVTILYTKTTDTASSPVAPPKVEAMHAYSTDEKVVGTWIDGSTVYERTVYGTASGNNNTWSDTGIIIPNVGVFMTIEKGITNPIDWDAYDDRVNAMISPSTGAVKVKQNISSSNVEYTFYIVLHYTKTTDTATA